VLRRQYAHVGPGVIADHMDLCGLSRCLLVPVVRRGADPAEQERLAFDLYAPDPRFALAFCPPPPGTAAEAMESIQAARARHPIRAVKVNANVQGLDLASPAGKASLAHLLSACRALSLPLVVHGGVSRLLEDPRGRSFASLENLESFAWRAAAVPVVLCHAGLFGCPSAVVEALWPRLARLLAQNDNVLVDLSGLSAATLRVVLERVDPGRIVFGSDALYFPPWSAVVRVLFTLEQLGLPVESTFAQLAGANPERHLFGGANPAQSVSDGSPHAH
jgi:predicted TIM-barrel fold metal-dependent hydrolase